MERVQAIIGGTRVADAAAAGSIGAAAAANLTQINLYVQIAAGMVAIIAGACAAAFHIVKTIQLREHNRAERMSRRVAALRAELDRTLSEAEDHIMDAVDCDADE
jgi:hypothetical protein